MTHLPPCSVCGDGPGVYHAFCPRKYAPAHVVPSLSLYWPILNFTTMGATVELACLAAIEVTTDATSTLDAAACLRDYILKHYTSERIRIATFVPDPHGLVDRNQRVRYVRQEERGPGGFLVIVDSEG